MIGKPPNAGLGRPKGTPNKATKLLKDAILMAAEMAGNDIEAGGGLEAYLKHQAIANPGPFIALLGKVLPIQINGTINVVPQEDALDMLDDAPVGEAAGPEHHEGLLN